MEDAIVRKLRGVVGEQALTECRVVYVLVEVRKLLDLLDDASQFESLKFYCDWAMHAWMDRRQAKDFVASVDEWLSQSFGSGTPPAELNRFVELLYLSKFRDQLREFLRSHELPSRICEGEEWSNFLRLYSQVIEDCPLVCEGTSRLLKYVDRVVLTRTEESTDAREPIAEPSPFRISWELYWRNRCKGRLDLHPNQRLVGSTLVLGDRLELP